MEVLQEKEEVLAAQMASTSLEEHAAAQAQSAGAESLKESSKLGICGGFSEEEEEEEEGEIMGYTEEAQEFHAQGGGSSCSGWEEGRVGEVWKDAWKVKGLCGTGLEEQAPEQRKPNNAWEFEEQRGAKAPEEGKQEGKNDAWDVKAEEKGWEVQAPEEGKQKEKDDAWEVKAEEKGWEVQAPEERKQEEKNDAWEVKAEDKGWEVQAPEERKQEDGWGEAKSGDGFFDFPPGSPSACLQDKSWGGEYVDVGYLESEVEVGGQTLQVRVAYTAVAVEDWLGKCTAEDKLFGFDVEWRPNRFRGDDNKVAMLQLSLASRCLLVQLLYIDRIPSALEELLADPQVKLGGVGVKGDTEKLLEDYGLRCCGEVDLALYAAELLNQREMRQAGLSKLSQHILELPYKKSKTISCSNWAVEGLSFAQIRYAASDAWISYSLLVALKDLEAKARLEHKDQETQPQPALSGLQERTRIVEEVAAFLKAQKAASTQTSPQAEQGPTTDQAPTVDTKLAQNASALDI